MILSIISASARRLRFRHGSRAARYMLINAIRGGIIAGIVAGVIIITPTRSAEDCPVKPKASCPPNEKVDLIFLVDRSGSLGQRGQSYNVEIEGIRAALGDSTVIPQDGSVAVGVVTFSLDAQVPVHLKEIKTSCDAADVASQVEKLACPSIENGVSFCPADDTDYNAAIMIADAHLRQSRPENDPRRDARRVMIMCSDGMPNVSDFGSTQSARTRDDAAHDGIRLELDAILIGVETASPQSEQFKALERITFRVPPSAGQPRTLIVNAGGCNQAGASLGNADCNRQFDEFASHTRRILRGEVEPLDLVVRTEDDPPPDTPVAGNNFSLRQAIERANCAGSATITFASNVKTISPRVPLPALTAPEIKIDGCAGSDCAGKVTIDGSMTDPTKGEQHSDGILIRSSHDVVRGLRIMNFRRAGVAVDPVAASDKVGFNRIELNALENNTKFGVLVLDAQAASATSAIRPLDNFGKHNIANTISRNDISGSATLIDLNGDAPTPNDPGDADQGPNTLLNFPDLINVAASDGALSISGRADGPGAAGATVEIFTVRSHRIVSGKLVIDAVTFLASAVADAGGAFNKTGVPASASCALYTATVTDHDGNTSELMFETSQTKPARPVAAPAASINFGNVNSNSSSSAQPVPIVNIGNAPLCVASCALAKCNSGDRDDTARFNMNGCPSAPINPGDRAVVNVTFTPNACGAASACLSLQTNDPYLAQAASRLSGAGLGFPQARIAIDGGGTAIVFDSMTAGGKSKKERKRPSRDFSVENSGCGQLDLTSLSILRIGDHICDSGADDSKLFSVTRIAADGTETAVGPGTTISIPEDQNARFRVRFNAVIPPVTDAGGVCNRVDLPANRVLPGRIESEITFTQNGADKRVSVPVKAQVATEVELINSSQDGSRKPPLVTLAKSGDILEIKFFVFDSNLDVSKAHYEFFDSSGRPLPVDNSDADLALTISQRVPPLITGQSFTVIQRFSNASEHPKIARASVRVTDGEVTTDAVMSGPLGSTITAAGIPALRSPQGSELFMPIVKLMPVSGTRRPNAGASYIRRITRESRLTARASRAQGRAREWRYRND